MLLDIPDVRQREDHDCGAAALDAVCRFWGVRERGPSRLSNEVQGMAPDTVEAVLRAVGFTLLSGSMGVDDLRHLTRSGRPVLCPVAIGGGHWVVVRGVERGRIHYHDPLSGPEKLREADWLAGWSDSTRFGHGFVRWGICPAKG